LSARVASIHAFWVSSIRCTSGQRTIGTGSPAIEPWMRSFAYASACWYARSAIPTPSTPTASRALFIITNITASPRFSSPSRYPVAPS
jgi:hypothetical protein